MDAATNILNILSNGQFTELILNYIPPKPNARISDEQIRHMHSVAELMYRYKDAFHVSAAKEECYLLGLLHDIGYINGKENHESHGYSILENAFGPNVLSECICWHGSTPDEYKRTYNCSDEEIPNMLILLWWADLSVESNGEHAGEIVGFAKRLDSIKDRLGENSDAYRNSKETVDWLINYFAKDFISCEKKG